MIALYASGGLGNQLFNMRQRARSQIATARALVVDAAAYRDQWGREATRPHVLHRFPARAKFRNLGRNGERRPLASRILRRLNEDAFATGDRPSGKWTSATFPASRQWVAEPS
jgi:hypothetical protein